MIWWRERAPKGREADQLCNDITWGLFTLAQVDSHVIRRELGEKIARLEKLTAP